MAGDGWESSGTSMGSAHCDSSDRPGVTWLLLIHSQGIDRNTAVPVVLKPYLFICVQQLHLPKLPSSFPFKCVFLAVSASALNTFGFPSLTHQPQSFLCVLYSHLLFFVGSACWAEREEWILCCQSSEKGRGANWWWRGMYHGGKEGPRSCLGKSISHTSLLHISDKGKKYLNGDSNKTNWAF